jgi:hypothetical protein
MHHEHHTHSYGYPYPLAAPSTISSNGAPPYHPILLNITPCCPNWCQNWRQSRLLSGPHSCLGRRPLWRNKAFPRKQMRKGQSHLMRVRWLVTPGPDPVIRYPLRSGGEDVGSCPDRQECATRRPRAVVWRSVEDLRTEKYACPSGTP